MSDQQKNDLQSLIESFGVLVAPTELVDRIIEEVMKNGKASKSKVQLMIVEHTLNATKESKVFSEKFLKLIGKSKE